jgi:hypothetical protein
MKHRGFALLAIAAQLQAHTPAAVAMEQQPEVLQRHDGQVIIRVSGAWSLFHGLEAVRREYGLVLDYEEGPSNDPGRLSGEGVNRIRRPASYTISTTEPNLTSQAAKAQFIQDILRQFQAQGSPEFVVIQGENGRLTVAPASASERLLDTPIILKAAKRTISETAEAIFAELRKEHGISIQRGGIVDSGLDQTTVTVGSDRPTSVRKLLEQALDGAPCRFVWGESLEPSDGNYYISFEPAVKLERSPTGELRTSLVR